MIIYTTVEVIAWSFRFLCFALLTCYNSCLPNVFLLCRKNLEFTFHDSKLDTNERTCATNIVHFDLGHMGAADSTASLLLHTY